VHVTVDLTAAPPGVQLVEPTDCRRFDVTVRGSGDLEALDRALLGAAVGRIDAGEALVEVTAVRALASGYVDERWEEDFTAMLDLARGKGWLTDDGHAIRAHVEWR
jgi:hypothetical protein